MWIIGKLFPQMQQILLLCFTIIQPLLHMLNVSPNTIRFKIIEIHHFYVLNKTIITLILNFYMVLCIKFLIILSLSSGNISISWMMVLLTLFIYSLISSSISAKELSSQATWLIKLCDCRKIMYSLTSF